MSSESEISPRCEAILCRILPRTRTVRLVTAGFDISGESPVPIGGLPYGGSAKLGPGNAGSPAGRPDGEGFSARTAPSMGRVDHAIPAYCGALVARREGMKVRRREDGVWRCGPTALQRRPSPGGRMAAVRIIPYGHPVGQKRGRRRRGGALRRRQWPAGFRDPNHRTGARTSLSANEPTTVTGMLSHVVYARLGCFVGLQPLQPPFPYPLRLDVSLLPLLKCGEDDDGS